MARSRQPRLCIGVVVVGTCTINVLDGGGNSRTLTIPPGTYWVDPLYSGIVASGTLDAVGILTQLLDTADTTGTYTCLYASGTSGEMTGWGSQITRNTGTFNVRASNAGTNTDGRRFLQAIGFDQFGDMASGISNSSRGSLAIFDPLRGENVNPDEVPKGFGVTVETEGGTAFTADLGSPLLARIISFPGLKASSTKRRFDSVGPLALALNFESTMWTFLTRGAPVRYWGDKNAVQNTYIAANMSATASSFTTPVNSVYADQTIICVDGEQMFVASGNGTTTTTVYRDRDKAVAHSKYAPVSTDFVGTYVLGTQGGNVNQGGFNPKRRADYDDRWDLDLSLVRTVGV
jgi:hypothetical protein